MADKLQTSLHIEANGFKHQVGTKTTTLNTHIQMLMKCYQRQSSIEFAQAFDSAVAAINNVDSNKKLSEYCQTVYRSAPQLFKKGQLPPEAQIALDNLYSYAINTTHRDLIAALSKIHKSHIPTNIQCPHSFLVLLNKESIDENDVKKYYATILEMAHLEMNPFVQSALSKYPTLFAEQKIGPNPIDTVPPPYPPPYPPYPIPNPNPLPHQYPPYPIPNPNPLPNPYPPYPIPNPNPFPNPYPPYPPCPQPSEIPPGVNPYQTDINQFQQYPSYDPNQNPNFTNNIPMYRTPSDTPSNSLPQYPQVPPAD